MSTFKFIHLSTLNPLFQSPLETCVIAYLARLITPGSALLRPTRLFFNGMSPLGKYSGDSMATHIESIPLCLTEKPPSLYPDPMTPLPASGMSSHNLITPFKSLKRPRTT